MEPKTIFLLLLYFDELGFDLAIDLAEGINFFFFVLVLEGPIEPFPTFARFIGGTLLDVFLT